MAGCSFSGSIAQSSSHSEILPDIGENANNFWTEDLVSTRSMGVGSRGRSVTRFTSSQLFAAIQIVDSSLVPRNLK